MPIYVYACKACEHRTEQLQKHDEPGPEHCESCGSPAPEQVKFPGGSGFSLKGNCWSRDGYASGDWDKHYKAGER